MDYISEGTLPSSIASSVDRNTTSLPPHTPTFVCLRCVLRLVCHRPRSANGWFRLLCTEVRDGHKIKATIHMSRLYSRIWGSDDTRITDLAIAIYEGDIRTCEHVRVVMKEELENKNVSGEALHIAHVWDQGTPAAVALAGLIKSHLLAMSEVYSCDGFFTRPASSIGRVAAQDYRSQWGPETALSSYAGPSAVPPQAVRPSGRAPSDKALGSPGVSSPLARVPGSTHLHVPDYERARPPPSTPRQQQSRSVPAQRPSITIPQTDSPSEFLAPYTSFLAVLGLAPLPKSVVYRSAATGTRVGPQAPIIDQQTSPSFLDSRTDDIHWEMAPSARPDAATYACNPGHPTTSTAAVVYAGEAHHTSVDEEWQSTVTIMTNRTAGRPRPSQ